MKKYNFLPMILIVLLVFSACDDSKNEKNYTGEPGTISIVGDIGIGSSISVDISELNGTGAVEYVWVIGETDESFDFPIRGRSELKIPYTALGKRITVIVRRDDWDNSVPSVSFTAASPVSRGWMILTIANENHLGSQFTGLRAISIDSNGMAYTADSRFIYKINIDSGEVSPFFDSGSSLSGSPKYLAVGQDDSIYMPQMWYWWNIHRWFADGSQAPAPGVEIFKDMFYYGVPAFDAKNYPVGDNNGTGGGGSLPYQNAMEGGFAVDEDGNMYVGAIYHGRSIIKVVPRVYNGSSFVSHQTASLLAGGVKLGDGLRPYPEGTQTQFYSGPIGINNEAIDLNGVHGNVAIASSARFHDFGGMAAGGGYLYVTDTHNDSRIRKINTTTGATSTLTGGDWSYQDGPLATAAFTNTKAITYGSDGNLYVVDRTGGGTNGGPVIRKIDLANGVVSTIAGDSNAAGYVDGFALGGARFQANIEGIAYYDHPELGPIIIIIDKAAGNRDQANAFIRMLYWDDSSNPID